MSLKPLFDPSRLGGRPDQDAALRRLSGRLDALQERVEKLEAGDTLAVADTANPASEPLRRGPGRPPKVSGL